MRPLTKPRLGRRAHQAGTALQGHGPGTLRRSWSILLAALVVLALLPFASSAAGASTGRQLVVAPWGSDSAAGTAEDPFGTMQHAMDQLEPGDTLTARGGTYRERIVLSYSTITPGRADAPITVQAAPGERPVIEGRLRLSGADHWTLSGINVTWSSANTAKEHMVVFSGGTNWRYTNAEIWDARSFAAILVRDNARNFSLDHLYVHDTHKSNDLNQDHLIYVDNGHHGNGTIERNVLAHSPNGRGVKLGPGSLTQPGTNNITIRYNTFHANTGPSNIQLSGSTSNNTIHHNVLVRPGTNNRNITTWNLDGTGNKAHDNLVWDSAGALDSAITDGGGNAFIDPVFADPTNGDYRPTNPNATNHGAHAGTTPPTTTTTTTPSPGSGSAAPPTSGPAPAPVPEPSVVQPAPGGATTTGTDRFIEAVTTDFLGRAPAASEVRHWREVLRSGTPRASIVRSFAYSAEWVGVLVDGYYRSTLGRTPDADGRRHWIAVIGSGVTPADVAAHFYASDEYFRRAGGTNEAWVRDLYTEILDRRPDGAGLRHWVELADRGISRAWIARDFYQSLESRLDRVHRLYGQLLGRRPDSAGAAHWSTVLADGRDVELAMNLAASEEYFRRTR